MSTVELRTQFHQIIEETDDYEFLQNSFNNFLVHNQKIDILDLLNVQQKADLYEAIEDVKQGRVVSHKQFRANVQTKINQCLTK